MENNSTKHFTLTEYAKGKNVSLSRYRRNSIERRVMRICMNRNIETTTTQEERRIKYSRKTQMEKVGAYPETILEEVFRKAFLI